MNKSHRAFNLPIRIVFSCLAVAGCSSGAGTTPNSDGGAPGLGGATSAGASSGGASSGGALSQGGSGFGGGNGSGGTTGSGGQGTGGSFTSGGKANGGNAGSAQGGGSSSGGMSARGGAPSGGASSGGGASPSGGAKNGGSSSSGGAAPATFAMAASVIGMRCGIAGCHGTGAQKPPLANNSSLYNTLKTFTVKECGGKALVVPSDAANSSLIKLMKWECTDSSNGPFVMPQGCIDDPCLSAQEIATLTGWIAAGAPGP